MEITQQIDLGFASIELLGNGIIRVEFFNSRSIGEEECRTINNNIGILSKGRPARVLMVTQTDTVFETDAREFSASEEGLRYTIGDALVAYSLAHKILINFYLKFNKPRKPSKAFTNEADAIQWLLSLQEPA